MICQVPHSYCIEQHEIGTLSEPADLPGDFDTDQLEKYVRYKKFSLLQL